MSKINFSFTAQQLGKHPQKTELIAYANRCGENLTDLRTLLQNEFRRAFDGVHILPFYTPFDGMDAGFDPADHASVDPRLGTWQDVQEIGETHSVMADLIVNHVSYESAAFQDVLKRGRKSPHAQMFLTYDAVFPAGAKEEELAAIYRPRPGLPFTHYNWGEENETRLVWTTFTPQQIDIDVNNPAGREYLDSLLKTLAAGGVKKIRLDAVGYAIKTPGTSCFMTPETFAFIDELTAQARQIGLSVLVEIHSFYEKQIEIASKVDFVYDFALPPLILHALHSKDISPLLRWLQIRPLNAVTVLDTHDGIGIVDIGKDSDTGKPGLVSDEAQSQLVESIHAASQDASRKATGWAASNVDIYQVNCTFPDACGNAENYLLARALQIFTPGVAQIYYAGLINSPCDIDLLKRTGVGRDINRPYYTVAQVRAAMADPAVEEQLKLIELRRTHPAFDGDCQIEADPQLGKIDITWKKESEWVKISADFQALSYQVTTGTAD